jgi:hypothetical protein
VFCRTTYPENEGTLLAKSIGYAFNPRNLTRLALSTGFTEPNPPRHILSFDVNLTSPTKSGGFVDRVKRQSERTRNGVLVWRELQGGADAPAEVV